MYIYIVHVYIYIYICLKTKYFIQIWCPFLFAKRGVLPLFYVMCFFFKANILCLFGRNHIRVCFVYRLKFREYPLRPYMTWYIHVRHLNGYHRWLVNKSTCMCHRQNLEMCD